MATLALGVTFSGTVGCPLLVGDPWVTECYRMVDIDEDGHVDAGVCAREGEDECRTVEGGESCPEGFSSGCLGDDCDDTDATAFPDAPERCADGVDNDCDEVIDKSTCEGQ